MPDASADYDITKPTSSDLKSKEYKGLSSDEIQQFKRVKEAFENSKDFVTPYFEKFHRFQKMARGVPPDELSATYSQVMINRPWAIIQDALARTIGRMSNEEALFHLNARSPEMELWVDPATNWLQWQVQTLNQFYPNSLPCFQSTETFGTGYRVVSHFTKPDGEVGFSSQNAKIWNIWPSRNGGLVNAYDNRSEACVEWVHWIVELDEGHIKAFANKPGWKKQQIGRMLSKPPSDASADKDAIDLMYQDLDNQTLNDGANTQGPTEIEHDRTSGDYLMKRRRCVWTFFRNRWVLTGEGQYLLYEGPPTLDWIPIAKYVHTPDFENWFGIGSLEMIEDVMLAYLLNFGFRMDYLVNASHPMTYVRSDIAKANPGEDFDPGPYKQREFPAKVKDIAQAIWHDRFPEISPQTFIEDTGFQQIIQMISAQPNYSKGMGGAGTLANETATGIVSLISEGNARSTMQSLNIEHTGLHNELMLFLKYGARYVNKNPRVKVDDADLAIPWSEIPHKAITDGYGIELMGTKSIVRREEAVKTMLTFLPMLINNPNVPGQRELLKQSLEKTKTYHSLDKMLGPENPIGGQPLLQGQPTPGVGGARTVANEAQAVAGRTGAPSVANASFAV